MRLLSYFFIFILLSSFVTAFAVSPDRIVFNDEFKKSFLIYNDEGKNTYLLSLKGFDFFNYTPVMELEPKEKRKVELMLDMPKNVDKGIYKSRLFIKKNPKQSSEISLDTVLAIRIIINVSKEPSNIQKKEVFKKEITSVKENKEPEKLEEQKNITKFEYVSFYPEIAFFLFLSILVLILCAFSVFRSLIRPFQNLYKQFLHFYNRYGRFQSNPGKVAEKVGRSQDI